MQGNAPTPDQINELLQRPGDTGYATSTLGMARSRNLDITGGMIRDLYSEATKTVRAEATEYWL